MNPRGIKIFGDGADRAGILALYEARQVDGFTTNPTLMRKAGVTNYREFAQDILAVIRDLPVSFEVFSDDFTEMREQALTIAGWGPNVYVKIPITNTAGDSSANLIRSLSEAGVKLNVTAILSLNQVRIVADAIDPGVPAIVSVFAGRIADTGVDPVPIMRNAKEIIAAHKPQVELLWASPREILNIIQAQGANCDIITVSHELLKKRQLFGKELTELSLDTVKMFYNDALAAGYRI